MIYTDKKQIRQYLGMDKNLDTAIRYIAEHKMEELNDGRNEIDGGEQMDRPAGGLRYSQRAFGAR